MTADEVIQILGLQPHPEGGHYVETFRDPAVDADGRSRSTAIYFLLKQGEISRWHRVDAVETWHWYAGAPLTLRMAEKKGAGIRMITVGNDLAKGEKPQGIVPTGWWQAAETLGEWTLVGCTVAPGFAFSGFELAPNGWGP